MNFGFKGLIVFVFMLPSLVLQSMQELPSDFVIVGITFAKETYLLIE
jgi:hypothetical protein